MPFGLLLRMSNPSTVRRERLGSGDHCETTVADVESAPKFMIVVFGCLTEVSKRMAMLFTSGLLKTATWGPPQSAGCRAAKGGAHQVPRPMESRPGAVACSRTNLPPRQHD